MEIRPRLQRGKGQADFTLIIYDVSLEYQNTRDKHCFDGDGVSLPRDSRPGATFGKAKVRLHQYRDGAPAAIAPRARPRPLHFETGGTLLGAC